MSDQNNHNDELRPSMDGSYAGNDNDVPSELKAMEVVNKIAFWIMVLAIAIFTMAPFFYAISISFRTNTQVLTGARYLPEELNTINYENLFEDRNDQGPGGANLPLWNSLDERFTRILFNSAVVAFTTVTIALVVGSFAAYARGRVQFRGRVIVLYLVLAMTMFPQISILSGLFNIVNDLNIYGSQLSLIFSYPIFTLPFTVWVLTSFFQGLPGEIEQAALVDGASPFQTFWRILVPLTAPALVTTGLLAFIAAWNEYLFALTFTVINDAARTVPVEIANFAGFDRELPIADRVSAAVVVTIPLLVLVLIFQRRIIEGLTAGAVKG
jgi:trehalose/maltose transport system permease protein